MAVHIIPRSKWAASSLGTKIAASVLGALLAGGAAYGVTTWIVGLGSTSTGEGQSATVSNVTIVGGGASPLTDQLYPAGAGDVVVKITNPNKFPVTITKVKLPASTAYAAGYTTKTLTNIKSTCTGALTKSDVTWHYSTTTGTTHTLASPLTIAGSGTASKDPLTLTLTNDAFMGTTASATCEATYFKMPALKGVGAYAGGKTLTPASNPATDSWTS